MVLERTQQDLLENHEHNMANDKKIQLLSECQDYHYKQSSNVSSLARYIIYAIIATIWLTINAESFLCINWWLRIALFAAFLYLLADIVHYFWDSVSYRREYFKFEKETSVDDNFPEHEKRMNKFSKRSFVWLCVKFSFLIVISVLFLLGMFFQLL